MKKAIAGIILLFFSVSAFATTFTCKDPNGANDDKVTLTEDACDKSVLQFIPNEYQQHFRKAIGHVGGKVWVACWSLNVPKGVVIVIYNDSDAGMFPLQICRKDTEV